MNIIIEKCSARTHPNPTFVHKKKEKSHVLVWGYHLKNKITDYCQPPGQFSPRATTVQNTHTHAPSHLTFLWTFTARQSFILCTLILMPRTLSPLTCSNGSCQIEFLSLPSSSTLLHPGPPQKYMPYPFHTLILALAPKKPIQCGRESLVHIFLEN